MFSGFLEPFVNFLSRCGDALGDRFGFGEALGDLCRWLVCLLGLPPFGDLLPSGLRLLGDPIRRSEFLGLWRLGELILLSEFLGLCRLGDLTRPGLFRFGDPLPRLLFKFRLLSEPGLKSPENPEFWLGEPFGPSP